MSRIKVTAAQADQALERLTDNTRKMENLVIEFGLATAREQERREAVERKVIVLRVALKQIAGGTADIWAQEIAKQALEETR